MLDIVAILSLFLTLYPLLNKINRKRKIKKDLKILINKPLNAALKSFNDVVDDLSICMGMNIIGMYISPLDPEKKADEIVNNLHKSLLKLQHDINEIFSIIENHRDSFREIIPSEEWILIEDCIKKPKNEKTLKGWQSLVDNELFQARIRDQLKNNKFPTILNEKMNPMMNELGLKPIISFDAKAFFKNPSDVNRLVKGMQKYFIYQKPSRWKTRYRRK